MNQAKVYSRYNGLQRNDAKYVLENYIDLVKWNPEEDEVILDVGCGDGNVTIDLLLPLVPENVQKVHAMDLSKEMIQFAKDNNGHVKTEYGVVDFNKKLNNFDTNFHHIFSFYCLHWIQNQRICFENLYELLKPSGDMLLTFLANNPIYEVYTNLAKNNRWAPYMKDVKKFISPYHHLDDPVKELKKLMTETGFKVHKCELIDRLFVFHDMKIWKKSVIAVNPFITRMPQEDRDGYIADFFEEVRNLNCIVTGENNNEEMVETRYKLFVVYASKS